MIRGPMIMVDESVLVSCRPTDIRPPDEGMIWIDVEGQTTEELALLGQRFGFHPLALEDCEHLDQRPKVENYGDHYFVVVHGLTMGADTSTLELHELHVFLGRNYLVTLHSDPMPEVNELWERLQKDRSLTRHGACFLLYLLTDRLVDAHFPMLDRITDDIEDIEDHLLLSGAGSGTSRRFQVDPGLLPRILSMKRGLIQMRRVLSPQRDVFNLLCHDTSGVIRKQTTIYFRDVYDHLVRLHEVIEGDRDLLASVLEAHFSTLSQRSNETVTRLTLVSLIFLPLTFVTGFFGQNFEQMPFRSHVWYAGMLTSIVAVPVGLVIWFWRKNWFR